ncbi:MAG: DUF4230 domain-containing protein [Bacteroidota bacterium]
MIGYLLKNWKLLLDLILVVGGIIALAIFDPFGIFSKAKLKSTANLVSSVRSIGELTTAEYYGEVISSLHETVIYNVPADSLYDVFEACYLSLRRATAQTLNEKKRIKTRHWKEIKSSEEYLQLISEYVTNDKAGIYESLLVFLAVTHLSGESKDYYNLRRKEIRQKTEKDVLQYLTQAFDTYRKSLKKDREDISEAELDGFVLDLPRNFSVITNFHFDLRKESQIATNRRKKRDIVFVGRGSVKAGYRFGQLDETNFFYDEEEKVIQIFGLAPVVLDKDINPWFIPEDRIKGFDLVSFYPEATFEEAKSVKRKCKEKLLAQAQTANILESAQRSGQQAIQSFFSLLLDEPSLTVQMLDFPFATIFEMISADTLVTVEEALLVNQLREQLIKEGEEYQSSDYGNKLRAFSLLLNRLEKLAFVDEQFGFSVLSLEAARILKNALFVTEMDYMEADQMRQPLAKIEDGVLQSEFMQQTDSYKNHQDFIADFNEMLSTISHVLQDLAPFRTDTLYLSPAQIRDREITLNSAYFLADTVINKSDTVLQISYREKFHNPPDFNLLRYPEFRFSENLIADISWLEIKQVDSIASEKVQNVSIPKTDDCNLTKRFNEDLELVVEAEICNAKEQITTRPVQTLSIEIQKLAQKFNVLKP